MARVIIRMPGRLLTFLLRILSAGLSFVFVFFSHATGQAPQNRASTSGESGLPANSLSSVSEPTIPAPAYGIIAEYGMPYATYAVKGVLKSSKNQQPVRGIQVTLTDTTTKQARIDTTEADGSFAFSTSEPPKTITWLLKSEDIDGSARGSFLPKDTLITIPVDSLKGGVGFSAGIAEVNIELFLTEQSLRATDRCAHPAMQIDWSHSAAALTVTYSLPISGPLSLRLFGADGKLIKTLVEGEMQSGSRSHTFDTSGMRSGFYFAKLSAAGYAVVNKLFIR